MKKNGISLVISMLFVLAASAQANNLPVKEWASASPTPFVLYISGDGGYDSFSMKICDIFNKAGYGITAVNARSYFWNKKTSEQTAADIAGYLKGIFYNRKNQQLVLVGYSFGAEVLPFVVNKLADAVKIKLVNVVLLSPSTSTDFEVHLSDMFGGNIKRSMDVVAEMNKMGSVKTTVICGSDENIFPVKDIKLKNYSNETLPGGHHFNGNTDEVAKTLMKYFK